MFIIKINLKTSWLASNPSDLLTPLLIADSILSLFH